MFLLPDSSRIRLPPPGLDAFDRITFWLLIHATDNEYATLARSVGLRLPAPRFGTEPLQDRQLRLIVHFANGLWHRASVLIPQVGIRPLKTEPLETRVDLVHHTASTGQNLVVAQCPLDHLVV